MSQSPHIHPGKILQVGTPFFATDTLLSAVEHGLFTNRARVSTLCLVLLSAFVAGCGDELPRRRCP